jgi:hypothetical protein
MMTRAWTFWAVAVSSVGCLAATCVAWGATYNFYFNNVEQGPNSQASPSVSIQDGKLVGADPKSAPEVVPSPTPTPTDVAAPSGDTVPAKEPEEEGEPRPTEAAAPVSTEVAEWRSKPRHRNWRIDALGVASASWADSESGRSGVSAGYGVIAALTWNPIDVFGVRAFGGAMRKTTAYVDTSYVNNYPYVSSTTDSSIVPIFGAEAEWNPIRVNFWGVEDWFTAGIFGGLSNIHTAPENIVSLHAGIRARMNLTEALGLLAQTRFNLGYATFEAGLSLGL